jgi:hypothetical protein
VAAVFDGSDVALLGLALLRPFLGDRFNGVYDLVSFHGVTTADLPRSVYRARGNA